MARITEGWGGNRVTNGAKWMEFYWALDTEYSDGNSMPLTGNGKFPNNITSTMARLQINIVFDAVTTDTANTFNQSGSWPGYSGTVSISSVKEVTIYNQRISIAPFFGSNYGLQTVASLTGINSIPGTTSMNRWMNLPPRAWAKPDAPTITGYYITTATNEGTITFSGNQNNSGQDKYWQTTEYRIQRETGWDTTTGFAGNLTQKTFGGLNPNYRYAVQVRSANSDGGVSAWSPAIDIYTKPSAPTAIQAKRRTSDPTQIDVTWSINATYPATQYIQRRTTPTDAWSQIATLSSSATSYTDTYAIGYAPEYQIRTITPDMKTYSDFSGIVMADAGAIKQFVPGVNEIYHGSTKVTKVYFQNTMIWQS